MVLDIPHGAGSVGRCGRSADSRPESSEIGGRVHISWNRMSLYVVDLGTFNLGIIGFLFQSSNDHVGSVPSRCSVIVYFAIGVKPECSGICIPP